MTIKTKSTDPLFLAVEARLAKRDTATRPDRVKAFVEALESQITGAVVLPGPKASAAAAAVEVGTQDPGEDAVGQFGIMYDAVDITELGVVVQFERGADPYESKSSGFWYKHFLPITLPAPYHQIFMDACK